MNEETRADSQLSPTGNLSDRAEWIRNPDD